MGGRGGRGTPELAAAYERYVELYQQGRYQEAVPFAEEALRIGEVELGRDHPTTAIRCAIGVMPSGSGLALPHRDGGRINLV